MRATWLDHDTLGDPDLYLGLIDISGVDPGIADALRDAVKCFRNGLLTPCIAMLFSVVEGAWIELGQRQGGKVKDAMTNPQTSITAKVKKVVTALKNGALDKTWIAELEDTFEWTDILRRSRNAIHHGTKRSTRSWRSSGPWPVVQASQSLDGSRPRPGVARIEQLAEDAWPRVLHGVRRETVRLRSATPNARTERRGLLRRPSRRGGSHVGLFFDRFDLPLHERGAGIHSSLRDPKRTGRRPGPPG